MARKTPSKSRKKAQTKAKPPKPVKELETGQDAEVSQSHALEGEFLKRRRGRRFNLKHEHGTAREHIRTYRDFTSGLISMSEAEVRSRIATATAAAGRHADDVTLIVVTKFWPASDVRLLARFGVTDVGENRDQEASGKAAECTDVDVAWHFIGQLQTNKARSVARYADVVHSVDRAHLVRALDSAAVAAGRRLGCLVQVGLDHGAGRGGAAPESVPELADLLAGGDTWTVA